LNVYGLCCDCRLASLLLTRR